MTTSVLASRPVPLDPPDWLPGDVWPFPIASIEVDGRPVACTDTGGDGPVVLFCHVGTWSLLWRDVMLAMSASHRCVTFDSPGVGLSGRRPPREQTLATATRAVGALIDVLDLRDVTLVVHDLGGLAGLAAAADRADRIRRLAVVSSFGWRPRGLLLPAALRLFGSAPVRELSAFTGWLPRASSTRFGVGRWMSAATRRAWRAGLADRSARRVVHRLLRDAARDHAVPRAAEAGLAALADRPVMTVFGRFGDHFRFQRQWRRRRPDLTCRVVPRGLHFPMCDDPALVADQLQRWISSTA